MTSVDHSSIGMQGEATSAHSGERAGEADPRVVVLFDGVCNLCNGWVNWVIDRDPKGRIAFAALQSDAGQRVLAERRMSGEYLDSIVLVDGVRVHTKSGAVLRVAKRLSGLWPVLWVLLVIPWPVRDFVYGWVANRRYKWFGKRDACRLPTPELNARFLSS